MKFATLSLIIAARIDQAHATCAFEDEVRHYDAVEPLSDGDAAILWVGAFLGCLGLAHLLMSEPAPLGSDVAAV